MEVISKKESQEKHTTQKLLESINDQLETYGDCHLLTNTYSSTSVKEVTRVLEALGWTVYSDEIGIEVY